MRLVFEIIGCIQIAIAVWMHCLTRYTLKGSFRDLWAGLIGFPSIMLVLAAISFYMVLCGGIA